ncbi:TetR/AcrR family transcriptional regulator [Enterobacter sp.]|uniref:TetR/AcrR family transcriptional regulator n=1 Tax=Enterobacter sp. TaxID=42895 RepID=UPI00296E2965|nr:TetR/AcrR family transcriptional regulator [Enterobacter sp.]
MVTTKESKTPGRPRKFDAEQALATAQKLFHSKGYDALSVADLTKALGINPPSFYAAFGSKFGLYRRVLERYSRQGAIPFAEILRADRPVAQCLTAVLNEAARRYVADPIASGCMVVEGTHCDDREAREAACEIHQAAETMIRDFIARQYPDQAERLTDFMVTVMAGLSASARAGQSEARLRETVGLCNEVLEQALPDAAGADVE